MENRFEGGRAGLAMVTAGILILAMFALYARTPAFGQQSENCPDGYDHKSDPPADITEEWGTATLVNLVDGKFTAVEFFVKDGYTVDVCVKGGNEGFTEDTIVGEDTKVVSTPTGQEVSHYEWAFTFTPETFDLEVEKAWAGDLGEAPEGVTTTFDITPSATELEEGDKVTITETVTGLPESCTYTSEPVTPFDYTVDAADADEDGLITLTVTNTVSCESTTTSSTTTTTEATTATTEATTTTTEATTATTVEDEVLGTVVTTTTEAPTTTVEDEVAGTHVLPFTGIESDHMAMLAMALLGGGILTLVGSQSIRRRHEE